MNSAEEIYKLMTEKLAGTISAADDQLLEELIEEDANVREKWEKLSSMHIPDPPAAWIEVIDFQPKKSILRKLMPWTAAAAVMLLAAAVWKFNFFRSSKPVKVVAVRNDVILQPASGPAINLSEASGLIHVAGREIPVKNNTLFLNTGTTLPEGVNTISVPHGQRFDVALSDGSVVTLNAVTSMKFPFNFNGHTREITLDGEAYVKVARQTGKPFQVHLPNSTVDVLGTSFNINSYDSGLVKVSLIEGKVRMKAGKKAILMKPGQQAVFDQKTESLDTRPFNATVELGWQKGLYCFSEMPIEEVCGTIFRWFGVRAVVDNPAAGQRRFTGLLDKNTPMSFLLDGIKATTGTDFYFTADSTLHFK